MRKKPLLESYMAAERGQKVYALERQIHPQTIRNWIRIIGF